MSESGTTVNTTSSPSPTSSGGRGGRSGRGGRGRGSGRSNGRARGRGGGGRHSHTKREEDSSKNGAASAAANGSHNQNGNGSAANGHGNNNNNNNSNGQNGTTEKSPRGGGRGRGRGRSTKRGGRGRGGRGQKTDTEATESTAINGTTAKVTSTKQTANSNVGLSSMENKEIAVLSLPPAPTNVTTTNGAPMILSRTTHPPADDYESQAQLLSERLAEAALQDDTEPTNKEETPNAETTTSTPIPKKAKRKKKKKQERAETPPVPEAVVEEVSTTDALKALRGGEVSITASTQVKIARNESSASLNKEDTSPSKILPQSKNRKGKALGTDVKSNLKAARRFNADVRSCVEGSDPDRMRAILHDKHNHKFALDASTLQVVLTAYVMAAMFDDALYCLRNCTLPATLSTQQAERILVCMPQNLRSSNAYAAADMINELCVCTDFDSPTSRTYFLRIVRGIALEFLEEAMSARDRICSAPCERLVRSGTCVVDARLRRGKKATDLIVVPGEQLGVWQSDASENRGIQAGDAVSILPYAGPYPMSAESLDRNMIEATITNTNPMVLRLQDKSNAHLHNMLTENVPGNVFRVDKLANRMGFNRQLSAAVAISSPLGDVTAATYVRDPRRPCPQLIKAITAMDENIDQVMMQSSTSTTAANSNNANTKQQSSLRGGRNHAPPYSSTAALCAQAIPWSVADEGDNVDEEAIQATSRLALEKYGALEGLNSSQQLAVEGATSNRLTLVQGPPGTGKTRIAIRILEHWARLAAAATEKGENPSPILATSDSNIAVDNLVEGCAAAGLRVVRLGRPEAIRPELLRHCIDRPPSSYDNNRNNGGQNNSYQGGGGGGYKERMKQLKAAQIICCTCIGSGGDILDSLGPLERILVDEATQATEPAVLVPLMRGCRQLVLVGDHCQLPPTVLSTRAEEEGHGVPLFSRMVACGVPPFMLDTQYRMHPCIAMFPSDLFYGGLLKSGVSAPERRPLAGFPWPREEFPCAFIPVQGVEMDDGVSKFNEAEAEAACEAVRMLLQGGQCTVSDIAVVTPYAAQARLIRRMTRRMQDTSGPPFIEVSSIDGFQGREKEAVVFSAVRSNDYGAIGFTSDWRRINVSFTRARRALIVIGNDQTLRRGDPDTWMPWLAWVDAHGLNMDKPGIPRGRYEPEQLRRVRGGTTAAEMLKDVLARQQAQLKQAERQQERALKNTAGHIIGGSEDDDDGGTDTPKQLTLEEDLAQLENTDGHWDDSDDEDDGKPLTHSPSKATLASATSSVELRSSADEPVDVWDL